jgi:hypothetical protein
MIRHGKNFTKFVRGLGQGRVGEWWSELKVKLWYMRERHGYVDFARIDRRRIFIVDYKYGENVFVSAERNVQMAIYARSMIEMDLSLFGISDDTEVIMIIFQPRIRGDYPDYSEWKTTWGELKEMTTEELEKPAKKIIADPFSEELVFRPGKDACRWCPAKGFCKAKAKHDVGQVMELLPLLEPEPVQKLKLAKFETLSQRQIATILEHRPAIKSWLDGIAKIAYAQGVEGDVPEGLKFVSGRNSRAWKNKDRAVEILEMYLDRDEIFPPEMISPHQAEKRLKACKVDKTDKEAIEELIKSIPGRPALVPATDKRPAVIVNPMDLFEELKDDDGVLAID